LGWGKVSAWVFVAQPPLSGSTFLLEETMREFSGGADLEKIEKWQEGRGDEKKEINGVL